jgi:hypothetical protein
MTHNSPKNSALFLAEAAMSFRREYVRLARVVCGITAKN